MLIIFRSRNRNEAVIYSLSMLCEQNARHAANSLQCHLCLISGKKASCFYIYCKIISKYFHASPSSSSFRELFLTCHLYNKCSPHVHDYVVTEYYYHFKSAIDGKRLILNHL